MWPSNVKQQQHLCTCTRVRTYTHTRAHHHSHAYAYIITNTYIKYCTIYVTLCTIANLATNISES